MDEAPVTHPFFKQLRGAVGCRLVSPREAVLALCNKIIQHRCPYGAANAPCGFADSEGGGIGLGARPA